MLVVGSFDSAKIIFSPIECIDQVHDILLHVIDGRPKRVVLYFGVEVQRTPQEVFGGIGNGELHLTYTALTRQ